MPSWSEFRSCSAGDRPWNEIQWRAPPDSHYFEFLAERAAYVTYDGNGQTTLRWRADRSGEQRAYRPRI